MRLLLREIRGQCAVRFLKQLNTRGLTGKLKYGDRGAFPVFIVRLAGMKGVRNVRTVHEQGPFTQGTDVISGDELSGAAF